MPRRASPLTAEQAAQYLQEGWVMVPDVFAPEALEPLRAELTGDLHRAALKLRAEGKVQHLYEEEPFERRLTRIHDETPEILNHVGGGAATGRAVFGLLTDPGLLAIAESLVGPEIVASSVYRVRPKVPGSQRGVIPWHQDSGYFSPHCDGSLIVTCWVPLVEATPERGCLQVLPHAHTSGVYTHYTNGPGGWLVIGPEAMPQVEPVSVPVPLGGVLFLTNLTPHRSTPHTVDVVRWSIDVRYQSAAVPSNVGQPPQYFNLGRPRHEIACFPPEADVVIRSRRNPAAEVRTWEAFHAIRQRYLADRPPPLSRWVPLGTGA